MARTASRPVLTSRHLRTVLWGRNTRFISQFAHLFARPPVVSEEERRRLYPLFSSTLQLTSKKADPPAPPASPQQVEALAGFLLRNGFRLPSSAAPSSSPLLTSTNERERSEEGTDKMKERKGRICIVSGAGVSTASGIPDYRSPGRPAYNPIKDQEFKSNASFRKRYWARSFLGAGRVFTAKPNLAHTVVAEMEESGIVSGIITQNVDGLHSFGGAKKVIELHGTLHSVKCIDCGHVQTRHAYQHALHTHNTHWLQHAQRGRDERGRGVAGLVRPDGDVDLDKSVVDSFSIVPCRSCSSDRMTPNFIFHGGLLDKDVKEAAKAMAAHCSAVLVLGSSLTVYSAFSLVRDAKKEGKEVAVLNIGKTRLDDTPGFSADLHIEAPIGITLQRAWMKAKEKAGDHVR